MFVTSRHSEYFDCEGAKSVFKATSYCDGFRYGPGRLCTFFFHPQHCLVPGVAPTTSAVSEPGDEARTYIRRALTRVTSYCEPGWIAFNGSCYRRMEGPLQSRGKWNQGCATPCSFPTSINGEMELAFLLHHSSRPQEPEWIGPVRKSTSITHGTNPDGSDFETTLVSVRQTSSGNCISLPGSLAATEVQRGACGALYQAICEYRLPKGLRTGCPDGWLHITSYCYLFHTTQLAFLEADQHCASLATGAHLGLPQEAGMAKILRVYALDSGHSGSFWIGIQKTGGVWQSPSGETWHLDGWSPPSASSGACVSLSTAQDAPSVVACSQLLAGLCQAPQLQITHQE
ncbi:Lithostathine-1-beta [Amphibalanus amphitrite]|uniref:Lithostathine-1-beta n=1 Tax=Amphibalanus amphitrite TaxID=1232801 RepID=A0A6A4VIJ2_AMPAM|nr:Lithostathine-1-beta [Amphibalanus amphitrite]